MAISSLGRLYITALVVTSFHFFNHQWPGAIATIPKASSMGEEKNRLGSTPPTCHNRCHACKPCTAVQVSTPPVHDGVQPGPRSSDMVPSATGKKYTNYKPLGWKCRCGNHLFNP